MEFFYSLTRIDKDGIRVSQDLQKILSHAAGPRIGGKMKIARKSRFKIQLLLNAALLLAIATPIAFGLVHATPNRAQPKSQNKTALARDYKFEVASVKADRKSTRLNSSHLGISYAVFC